jgi:two-component system sensor histidine kinase MtrB
LPDRPAIRPGSLRRRLTIAFLLVAGLSAAALTVASYAIVREARLSDSVDRSVEQSRFNLVLANETLTPNPSTQEIDQLLAAYQRRGGFETVGTAGPRRFSSTVSLSIQEVPPALRELVASGKLGYERVEVGGTPYLVVGGQVKKADTALYYFYSEERLWDELAQLRNVLLAALGVVALLGALVGALLARRILAPVGRASQAAHSLAEGLLETRLPVERRFTSDVSHELRTPLTALVAEASLLGEQLDRMPPEARRPAELLVNDVARLRDLVEDLMEISRLDAGEAKVRDERVDLASLVRSAVRSRAWEDRVRVEGDEVVLQSDHRRLERIASNLIGNALEHGGREVTASVGRDGVGAFLEVSDRGAGIPPDRLPHVFDRFYKADTARAGPGSGLGLAIAIENARLLGGDIEVWSEVGRGTRFTLRLPD